MILIDACALSCVFDPNNERHYEFEPVYSFIKSKGKFVYGGSKYLAELRKASRFLSVLRELDRAGRVVRLDDTRVDSIERAIANQFAAQGFNDEHLVAIVVVGRVKVVCTADKECHRHLKSIPIYKRFNARRPKIYGGLKNRDLLK